MEKKLILANQMRTVRKILDTKEQMISNIMLSNANNFDLKTAWIGVKKHFTKLFIFTC